jgi:hypothetical protein
MSSLRFGLLRVLLLFPLITSLCTAANLDGSWQDRSESATWVFHGDTGELIQHKSINGNPGIVTIYFEWHLSDGDTSFTYRQRKITLRGSAGYDREQELDKTFTAPIAITDEYIALGGNKYWKQ